MIIQHYLQIQLNVVTNSILWDGNINTWQPPSDATMLIKENTQALVWELDTDKTNWVLVEEAGQGQIGFTWDETAQVLTTNQPKPEPIIQPTTTNIQTA